MKTKHCSYTTCKNLFFNVSFYLIIILLSFGDGCKSTGTDPINSSRFKGNILFAGNWGHDQVYIVDIDSNKIVDSIKGFGSVWNLSITHSKAKLYVSTREGPENSTGAAYSVDLNTGKISLILSKANILCISPSGEPIIFISTPYDSLKQVGIIDTTTDHISIIDTLDILDSGSIKNIAAFCTSKTILYTLNNTGNIFAYDYKKRVIVNTFPSAGIPLNIIISRDKTKLFIVSDTYGLIAFDLSNYSYLAANKRINTIGTLALSPDGQLLYITDPGKYLIPEPQPSGLISIFQASNLNFIGTIDINKISGLAYTLTDNIVLSKDGNTGYVSDFGATVFIVDLLKKQAIQEIKFPLSGMCIRSMVLKTD